MKLTLRDRVLILNAVLPQFDTRKNMTLKIAIDLKIALSTEEQKNVVATPLGNGQTDISFKTIEAITSVVPFEFTDEELMYLKQRVDFIDRNGMFSAETLPTYMAILDVPFVGEEYRLKWNEMQGITPDPKVD